MSRVPPPLPPGFSNPEPNKEESALPPVVPLPDKQNPIAKVSAPTAVKPKWDRRLGDLTEQEIAALLPPDDEEDDKPMPPPLPPVSHGKPPQRPETQTALAGTPSIPPVRGSVPPPPLPTSGTREIDSFIPPPVREEFPEEMEAERSTPGIFAQKRAAKWKAVLLALGLSLLAAFIAIGLLAYVFAPDNRLWESLKTQTVEPGPSNSDSAPLY